MKVVASNAREERVFFDRVAPSGERRRIVLRNESDPPNASIAIETTTGTRTSRIVIPASWSMGVRDALTVLTAGPERAPRGHPWCRCHFTVPQPGFVAIAIVYAHFAAGRSREIVFILHHNESRRVDTGVARTFGPIVERTVRGVELDALARAVTAMEEVFKPALVNAPR